jgi:iron complex outermembrane receptor protein
VEAEFRDPLAIASPNHPLADANNEIQVEPGDRIPGVPRNLFKGGADYSLLPQLRIGAEVLYNSDQVLRGDESNQLETVDGFAVFNVRGEFDLNEHVAIFANVDNVFDEDYETFGLLGAAEEVLGDEFDSPRFLSPGAPRAGWVGLRASF